MKQNDILLLTMAEALAALVQRVGDVEGVARIAGPQGEKGIQGIQGETGPAPTADELLAALNQIIASDPERFRAPAGKDGKPGREPTSAEIETAVDLWMAFNAQTIKGKDGRNGIDGATGTDGQDGRDGRDADPITAEQIQLAVDLWFEINRSSLRGERGMQGERGPAGESVKGGKGDRGERGSDGATIIGPQGIGIALIEQRTETTFHITLTDGTETEIELPRGKSGTTLIGGGGGGLQSVQAGEGIAVDNTDPRNPVVSATGTGSGPNWVTLDGVPQTLNFVSVGDGEVEMELTPI